LTLASSHDAEARGEAAGRRTYARGIVDDSFPDALARLAEALARDGVGALVVEDAYHREARLRFEPAAADAQRGELASYVGGVLRGFLRESFNCDPVVEAEGLSFRVRLGAGRDVNRKARP
jgi:hypothetical protein